MNVVLIMAAGSGKRMGSNTPKQFLDICGEPLLWHTLRAFNSHELIDAIYVVTNRAYFESVNLISAEFEKVLDVIEGGETRQDSVFNGLKYLKNSGFKDKDIVLIHDAARPLINEEIITNNINCCEQYNAVVTSLSSSDTLVRSLDGQIISQNESRNEIFINQTPQTFRFDVVMNAYLLNKETLKKYTDDAQIVSSCGTKVHLIQGSKLNFKVTTSDDYEMLKALISNSK